MSSPILVTCSNAIRHSVYSFIRRNRFPSSHVTSHSPGLSGLYEQLAPCKSCHQACDVERSGSRQGGSFRRTVTADLQFDLLTVVFVSVPVPVYAMHSNDTTLVFAKGSFIHRSSDAGWDSYRPAHHPFLRWLAMTCAAFDRGKSPAFDCRVGGGILTC